MTTQTIQKKRKLLRSPIPWFGGKGILAPKLLPLFPEHRIYVEPFGGAASLLCAKEPSPVEVYNDLDSGLVNLFRVIRDPEQFERFRLLAALTPYSREEFNRFRKTCDETQDDVIRAYQFFVLARMSFAGQPGHSWGSSVTTSNRGMVEAASRYLAAIDRLPEVHQRLMRVQIEHADFRHILKRYDTPETFFYLDPPYIPETRRGGGYRHELSAGDHADLVDLLLGLQGKAMLSGYRHAILTELERHGWRRVDFATSCFAVGRTRHTGVLGKGSAALKYRRVESVWLNYEPPAGSVPPDQQRRTD